MRPLNLLLAPLLLLAFGALAQKGQPFVTDIPFDRSLGEIRVNRMVQSADRSMLLCTPRGILAFDGAAWDMIPTPSSPMTMTGSKDGRVFIGMKKGAAELVLSDSGTYKVMPILGEQLTDGVVQILAGEKQVYFFSDGRMVGYDLATAQAGDVLDYGDRLFSGAFLLFDLPHLFFYQEGLFSYRSKKLSKIGAYAQMAEYQLLFEMATSKGSYLGFENGDVYVFDGIKMNRIGGDLAKQLKDNRLADAVVLNDSLIAFSTYAGGALVADRRNNTIRYTLNYSTGLPDNEISALGRDDNGGLWMAHGSGISRLDLLQPISRFHNYPGLRGLITSTAVFDNKLYVATGNGVFMLQETRDRAEVLRMMKEQNEERGQNQPETREPEPVREMPTPVQQQVKKEEDLVARYTANPAEVKKELSRKELRELKKEVKRRKKEGTAEVAQEAAATPEPEIPLAAPAAPEPEPVKAEPAPTKTAKKTPRPVRTDAVDANGQASFVFRPVNGVNVKSRQLIVVGNALYAATSTGVYRIAGDKAQNITPNVYVNHISASRDGRKLLVATMNGAMTVDIADQRSQMVNESSKVSIYNLVEDANGDLWGGADNTVIRYERSATGYAFKEYPLENQQLERVLVTKLDGKVHFLLPSGVWKFGAKGPEKTELASIPGHERVEYVLGNQDQVWVRSSSGWQVLNGKGLDKLLPYLSVFEDVRHLATDAAGNLYVVDKGAEIYCIRAKRIGAKGATFSVFIRKAMNEDRTPFGMGELIVQPNENSLVFQLSAPFFLKSQATEFQYRVEGLRENWSRWSMEPSIELPFVPAGDYVLHVRARNVLGEVSEVRTLPFTVLKPIWQRWYAIMVYVLAFAALILGIIKAREKSLKETQRELEEKVQERTADLAREKERTEKLLLNILPKETAEELQKRGKATARHYNQVSVLFTDFKGFTRFAESTRPEDLVNELDLCFIAFDDIIEKYSLEKIKTIGDAYMCAGGVPIRNHNNAIAIVLAGLEIRAFMSKLEAEKKARNERYWEIRIGVNTGPLTAGVVGKKKFAYDIWGDTVNTASRMESTSEPGKVNISASTYELVKTYFDCSYRGKLDAKGKGEVDMYFVNGIRPEFSENGDGVTPNRKLMELVA
jgi:class 3 adenylate cyclase